MEKINIAELLRDCPQGMELDCVSYDNVSFDKISDDKKANYPIFCYITDKEGNRSGISFTENGCESKRYGAKCVIFPKGKTTWKGFHRPFKDGDILANNDTIFIYSGVENNLNYGTYAIIGSYGTFAVAIPTKKYGTRFATEEEKQKLFDAIKANGYHWDTETKTLEKLFNYDIGTKVWVKSDKEHKYIHAIVGISRNSFGNLEYEVKEEKTGTVVHYPESLLIPISSVKDDYKLVTDEFNINDLKPFDKVLVRDHEDCIWRADFYSHYEQNQQYWFVCVGNAYKQCIPYNEETANLLSTDRDCSNKYKIWENK